MKNIIKYLICAALVIGVSCTEELFAHGGGAPAGAAPVVGGAGGPAAPESRMTRLSNWTTNTAIPWATHTAIPWVQSAGSATLEAMNNNRGLSTVAGTLVTHATDKYVFDIVGDFWLSNLIPSALFSGALLWSYFGFRSAQKVAKPVQGLLQVGSDLGNMAAEGVVVEERQYDKKGNIKRDRKGKAITKRVKYGGSIAVMRKLARHGGGAIADGVRTEFGEPMADRIKDDFKPVVKNTGKIVNNLSGFAWTALKVVVAGTAAYYTGRFLYNYLQKQVNKPRLDVTVKKAATTDLEQESRQRTMIFKESIDSKILDIYDSTLQTSQALLSGTEGVPYKHILLYGPAGSGKKMLAEQIAVRARMDFYEILGHRLINFKDADLSLAIEQFFKDLPKSANGAVVYFDNAQIFFAEKTNQDATSTRANLVNCLVEQVEKHSDKCMIVFGMPERPSLKNDMRLIIDQEIEISLPEKPERIRLLNHYRTLYFSNELAREITAKNVMSVLGADVIDKIAQKLNKATASQLAAFMKTIKIAADMPASAGLTPQLVEKILEGATKKSAAVGA